MANREMGEVDFEVDGTVYTMRLDCNAAIAAQKDCDIPDDLDFFVRLKTCHVRLGLLRAFFFRSVRIGSKRERFDKIEKAGDLVTRLGTEKATEIIREAFTWFLPPQEEGTKGGAGEGSRPSGGPTST